MIGQLEYRWAIIHMRMCSNAVLQRNKHDGTYEFSVSSMARACKPTKSSHNLSVYSNFTEFSQSFDGVLCMLES